VDTSTNEIRMKNLLIKIFVAIGNLGEDDGR